MIIKNIVLGLIIAVVFLMFSVYGTKLIYNVPDYSDYCGKDKEPAILIDGNRTAEKIKEIENEFRVCQEQFDEAREKYSKNLFIISLVFSLIIIIISALYIHVENVSGGLMLGALFFIIYGTGSYWRYMEDLLRFIVLGVALIVLIFVGFRIGKRKI